jgi:hypothetical protein
MYESYPGYPNLLSRNLIVSPYQKNLSDLHHVKFFLPRVKFFQINEKRAKTRFHKNLHHVKFSLIKNLIKNLIKRTIIA